MSDYHLLPLNNLRNLGGSFGSSQLSGSVKSKDPEALDELDFALGLGASNKSKLAAVGGTNKVSAHQQQPLLLISDNLTNDTQTLRHLSDRH